MDFAGKTVWITGASSGIGEGLATAFGRAGAKLVLSGRRLDALNDVAGRCQTEVLTLPFDTTDLGVLPGIVERAAAFSGGIDILVNNAGISQRGLALDTDFQVYRRIMEVDYFAPLALTQLVLPAMVKRGSGAIVNVSSVAGKVGSPLRTAYCGAKHAMVGWSDALRAEIAQYGVTVHVVTPGFVATHIADNALTADGSIKGHDADDPVNNGISIDTSAHRLRRIGQRHARNSGWPARRARNAQLLDFPRRNPEQLYQIMASMAPKVPR